MTVASALAAVEAACDTVTGLRVQTSAGKVNPPAVVVEPDSVQGPSAFGGSRDHVIRFGLLVQLGDYRNSRDRTIALADLVIAALESAAGIGTYRVDFGTLEYGGQSYAGATFAVAVVE